MSDSPALRDTTVYLLRHGATISNLARPPRLQGRRVDLDLSDEGQRQAARAAHLLARFRLSAVYSSPLKRAWQTAQVVAQPHGCDVVPVEALMEVDVGQWEGRDWGEIAASEPAAYREFLNDPGQHGYAGGENLQQVLARALPAVLTAGGRHPGEQIAIVAHNVVNRCLLGHFLELPLAKARELQQDNGGINVLRLGEGRGKVQTFNATFHLDP